VRPRFPQSEIRKPEQTGQLPPIGRLKALTAPRRRKQITITWQQITAAYLPALVIMVTVFIAAVSNNKRIDDVNRRFDDVNKRFDDVNKRIDDVNRRIDELRADFKEEIKELRGEMRDLRSEMKEGFRKLEERFEHPIARP